MKKPTKAKLRARSAERVAFAQGVRTQYLRDELDVVRTDSGLGYVLHEDGRGVTPLPGQKVEVHYVGMLESSGSVFEESFGNPRGARFRAAEGEVIAGLDEAVTFLGRGDEATLFVPSELGYGADGRGQAIPPHSDLILYVEIITVG